ncbi:MAG: hypothetical protein PF447_05165 [Spirochaetaceae bacterium]|jgi:flavodoxin|nr:hypothetical protein [Spirochaetaceae bacterium]
MNALILYYSRDGNTKIAAEYLSQKLQCDIASLNEKKPSRSFILAGFRSVTGKRRKLIGDPWGLCKDRDVIILGAPIWAGNGNPVLNSFLDDADFSGKKVYLFTLQADPQLKSAVSVLEILGKRVEDAKGIISGTLAIHGNSPGKTAEKSYITNQLDHWEIS